MRVRVEKLVFRDGARIRPGSIIEIDDKETGDWFTILSEPKQAQAKQPKQAQAKQPKQAPKETAEK